MLDNEFKNSIDSARQILVGKVPDPKAQIEQITTAMIYKFMDFMDRENIEFGLEPQFFVGDYQHFSWSNLLDTKLSGQQKLDLYIQAITQLPQCEHIPQLFRDIFKGTFVPFREARTFNLFLKEIDKFKYDNSENLGNAFEYLLSILGSQGDAGQFRTPRHIIDFIVSAVDPQKDDTILDPACGTAGFLISAYKHIIKINSKNFNHDNDSIIAEGSTAYETVIDTSEYYIGDLMTPIQKRNLLANVTGYDISPDMVKLALVNLYLHGFKQPKIYEYDTLSDDKRWDDDFDVILANPPFMSPKGGITPHKRFSIQANRAEVLFVDYIAEHLRPGGRAGIIVPEGIIFQASNAYKNLRKNLVENWGLYAVVSLPSGVFQPYSGVKTSILFLDKYLAKQSPDILFLKIENDGYDLGAQRRKIDKNDLPKALKAFKEWKSSQSLLDDNIAMTVPKAKIAQDGDYNLTAERYKEAIDYSNVKWDMVELGEVCETTSGGTPLKAKQEYYENGKIPWLRSGEVAQGEILHSELYITEEGLRKSSAKLLPPNTVLIAMYGATAGQVGLLKFESATNQAICGILPNEGIVPKFLFHLLYSMKVDIIRLAGGGAQPNISQKIIKNLKIPLPPLQVQEEIVAEIEQYQKVIDGAKQVVENYKPQIDIDPDWEKVELGEVCDKITDGSHFSPTTINKGYPYVTVKDINNGKVDLINCKKISYESYIELKKNGCRPNKNDVLFSKDGTVGKTFYVNFDKEWVVLSSLAIITPKPENIIPKYLYHILSTDYFKNKAIYRKTGLAIKRIVLKTLKTILIPLPPLSVQEEIVARIEEEQKYVDGCKKLIEIYEQKIKDRIGKVWGINK
ncbi:N-6 DNA methylase [bacterium]|nr:N-6 DNA methylase [bacterium]